MPDGEDAARLRLDAAEETARADRLEALYLKASVEANAARIRIRELEDAILMHAHEKTLMPEQADEALYRRMGAPWS